MTRKTAAPDAFGTTLFCDDIRFEVDGKISLIGSYGGDMLVKGDFPVVLPKFAASILFVQRQDVFSKALEVKVFLPGDAEDRPSIASNIADVDMPTIPSEADGDFITVRANMIMSPLAIDRPGHIKVRVTRDGVDYAAGSLQVIAAPPPATAGSPGKGT